MELHFGTLNNIIVIITIIIVIFIKMIVNFILNITSWNTIKKCVFVCLINIIITSFIKHIAILYVSRNFYKWLCFCNITATAFIISTTITFVIIITTILSLTVYKRSLH